MKCKVTFLSIFLMSCFMRVDPMMEDSGSKYIVRRVKTDDIANVVSLYKVVAAKDGGIARKPDEITLEYITEIVSKSISNGLMLIAVNEFGELIGSVCKYRMEPESLSHCFGGGTTLVHPDWHGKGIGKKLWTEFLETVKKELPDIARVELFVRESNIAGVKLYTSVGFEVEGKLKRRIISAEKNLETDLIMAWFNPNANI